MRPPRTVVSGGTGFVGRFIVEALLSAGHDVVVAGRHAPEPDFFSLPVGFVPLELGGGIGAAALFGGTDFFVHAAFDHVSRRYRGGEGTDPDAFRLRNLAGSVALFEAAKAARVRRAVFVSSRAVYGAKPPGEILTEATAPRPDTLYGEIKLAAENALASLTEGRFAGVSLRITGVYGPAGPCRAHKWQELFSDYLDGKPVAPRAGTEVHGEDVGKAVTLMLTAPGAGIAGRTFNVSDSLVDRRDILHIVRRATGATHPLPAAGDKASVNVMKTERLRALGWRPGGVALFEKTVAALAQAFLAAGASSASSSS